MNRRIEHYKKRFYADPFVRRVGSEYLISIPGVGVIATPGAAYLPSVIENLGKKELKGNPWEHQLLSILRERIEKDKDEDGVIRVSRNA